MNDFGFRDAHRQHSSIEYSIFTKLNTNTDNTPSDRLTVKPGLPFHTILVVVQIHFDLIPNHLNNDLLRKPLGLGIPVHQYLLRTRKDLCRPAIAIPPRQIPPAMTTFMNDVFGTVRDIRETAEVASKYQEEKCPCAIHQWIL